MLQIQHYKRTYSLFCISWTGLHVLLSNRERGGKPFAFLSQICNRGRSSIKSSAYWYLFLSANIYVLSADWFLKLTKLCQEGIGGKKQGKKKPKEAQRCSPAWQGLLLWPKKHYTIKDGTFYLEPAKAVIAEISQESHNSLPVQVVLASGTQTKSSSLLIFDH